MADGHGNMTCTYNIQRNAGGVFYMALVALDAGHGGG